MALAVLGALGGIYATGYSAGSSSKQREWDIASAKQAHRELEQSNRAAGRLEKDRSKARIIYRDVTRTVDRLVDRPVYRNICLDDDGLRVAQCAIRGEDPATCKPDKPVPAATPASGRDRGDDLALDYPDG